MKLAFKVEGLRLTAYGYIVHGTGL